MQWTRRVLGAAAGLGLVAGALTGCGGGGSPARHGEPEEPPREEAPPSAEVTIINVDFEGGSTGAFEEPPPRRPEEPPEEPEEPQEEP